jgi:hypothetical protein
LPKKLHQEIFILKIFIDEEMADKSSNNKWPFDADNTG